MEAVLDRLFADPGVERVVVEPDARNTKSMSSTHGWASSLPGRWPCPDKQALLSFCTREAFHAARADLHSSPIHQGASL